jgi:sulfur dioxygenase
LDPRSTIGEERAFNPRLRVRSVEEFIELMNNLKLPNPMIRDVVVPAGAGGDRAPLPGACHG